MSTSRDTIPCVPITKKIRQSTIKHYKQLKIKKHGNSRPTSSLPSLKASMHPSVSLTRKFLKNSLRKLSSRVMRFRWSGKGDPNYLQTKLILSRIICPLFSLKSSNFDSSHNFSSLGIKCIFKYALLFVTEVLTQSLNGLPFFSPLLVP